MTRLHLIWTTGVSALPPKTFPIWPRKSRPHTVGLTHWGRDKMDAISQTTFWAAFFLNENIWIPIKFSLKFVPKGPIHNIPALVQIMAWRRPGDKPFSEPMLVSLLTHICVTPPQWVNRYLLWNTASFHLPTINEIVAASLQWIKCWKYFARLDIIHLSKVIRNTRNIYLSLVA